MSLILFLLQLFHDVYIVYSTFFFLSFALLSENFPVLVGNILSLLDTEVSLDFDFSSFLLWVLVSFTKWSPE